MTLRDRLEPTMRKGDWDRARRMVEAVLRKDPIDLEARALREQMILLEERERRRRLEPLSAQAQCEAGFSYLTLGCDVQAMEAFREALRLEPELFLARVLLGVAYHHQQWTNEARCCYEDALRLQPTNETCRNLLRALLRGEPPPMPVEDRPDVLAWARQNSAAPQIGTTG